MQIGVDSFGAVISDPATEITLRPVQRMQDPLEEIVLADQIPLVNRGRALGLLLIFRATEAPFLPEDVDFLSRASGQIAMQLKTRWHTARFPISKTSSPRRSCIWRKRSAAR
jgi:hypothetical protein